MKIVNIKLTEEQRRNVFTLAKLNNVPIHMADYKGYPGYTVDYSVDEALKEYAHWEYLSVKEEEGIGALHSLSYSDDTVTFSELLGLIADFTVNIHEFKLNDNYTVKINMKKKVVQAGGQTFPFETVIELVNFIKSKKS